MKTRALPFSSQGRQCQRGFTLLEVLLAVALVGLLMVALNTFLFSMGELWGRNSEQRLYEEHVRAVTRFLQGELRRAAYPAASEDGPFQVQDIRLESGASSDLITFGLEGGSRLIRWPEREIPELECALAVRDGQGLFLLWRSRLEKDYPDDPPRETLISPLVTSMAYDYFEPDFKRWETKLILDEVTPDTFVLPHRLRLTFSYEGDERTTVLELPIPGEVPPLF